MTVPATATAAEVVGQRQVAVGDDDVVEALAGDRRPAGVDGAVEPEPRAPQHLGAGAVGPRRDLVVVAGDERRQRSRPRRRRGRRASGPARRARRRSSSPARRPLAALNRLTGIRTATSPRRPHYGRSRPSATTGWIAHARARSLLRRDDERDHRRARSGAGAPTSRRGGRSRRGTGRRRSAGTSPPTIAGTRRPTSAPCASAACSARRSSRPGCASRAATPCSGCGRSPTAAGAPSSRSPTTRRCRSPAPSPGRDVLTARPPADVPIQGIDLPARDDRAADRAPRVGDASPSPTTAARSGPLPPGSPSAEATARGWVALAERASRLVAARRARLAEAVVAARCEVLLAGPPDAGDDPVGFLLGVAELVRLGELAAGDVADVVPDVAGAVARRSPARPGGTSTPRSPPRRSCWPPGGERRAVADLARHRRPPAGAAPVPPRGRRRPRRRGRRAAPGRGPAAAPRRHPAAVAGRQPRGPRPARRAGVDGVVRRALARRARRPCCGRSTASPSSSRPPPSTRPGAPGPPARRSGATPLTSFRNCSRGSVGVKVRDGRPSGGQRRANSTRRWVKSRSTGAPVSRWR